MPKTPFNIPTGKIKLAAQMVERVLDGDRVAAAQFSESMSTSDFPLAFSQVVNLNLLPQYQAAAPVWNQFATRRTVSDFNNVRFLDIVGNYENLAHAGTQPAGTLPIVPELSPFPYVSLTSSETSIAIAKRGLKLGYSWEEAKQDVYGFLSDFVPTLSQIAVDTEDAVATQALTDGLTAFSQVAGNPVLTLDSLETAIQSVRLRRINGRPVRSNSFVLMVPPALEFTARNIVNITQIERTIGNDTFLVNNTVQGVTVVVNEWLDTDTEWYVLPAPGATVRPSVIQAFLAGYETPELRVSGLQGGYYPGGQDVPWSEGSFDNDSIDFRLKTVGGAGLVSEEAIAWSTGAGA